MPLQPNSIQNQTKLAQFAYNSVTSGPDRLFLSRFDQDVSNSNPDKQKIRLL